MNRYVFIFIFFSGLLSQIFGSQTSNRIRQDIISREQLVLNSEYSYLADLNSHGIVDVLDIVQLVNIILE